MAISLMLMNLPNGGYGKSMRMPKKRICEVMILANGMTFVGDQFGDQMPKYQGRWAEKAKKILRHCTSETKFYDMRVTYPKSRDLTWTS